MHWLGDLREGLAALRDPGAAYHGHALSPAGQVLRPPHRAGGGLHAAWVRYRFRRKVRAWRASGVRFGSGVMAMPSVFIDTSYGWLISIGDRTRLAEQVRILCHDAGPQRDLGWGRVGPVTIGRDCVLNERVIVLAGVTIGDGCLVGSGSVVASDLPAGSRAMGVPARVYGTVADYLAETRRALEQCPCFGYRELHHMTREQREHALALMQRAGNRGFHYDPFSHTPFWVTPPEPTSD